MKKTQLLKDKVKWDVSGCLQQLFTWCLSVLSTSFFCWGEGYGRRERWRWSSEGDPGWAERAGGEGRSTRQTEDQEHLCHQVPKLHSHMLSKALWACLLTSAAVNKSITAQKTLMTTNHDETLSNCFVFSSCSYINQRNRSWNIVESEKALVVSVKYPLSKIRWMHLSSWS